ncbi:MAG TPA: class I SAM-dependent methyltransferase [Patescibacteria group bacterium]|nr:class I SAM-dependent methyltransferase [Patescibacteria group bacterium]
MNKVSDRKRLHEKYHKKTKKQFKTIESNNFTYRLLISELEKLVKKDIRILDIGCGAGTLDFYIANKGPKILGIDISDIAINSCIETAKQLGIKNAEFKRIYFPRENVTGKFDLIIFTEVIEHLEDDVLALQKINKLLNTNGKLILSTPSKNAPLNRLGLTKKFDLEVGHLRRYTEEELTRKLKKEGFKILKVNKTEGIIRNFLFVNPIAGKFVRFIKFFVSDAVTIVDNFTLPLFGNSNYIIIAKKQ